MAVHRGSYPDVLRCGSARAGFNIPGIVPIDTVLLARTGQVGVAVTGLSAFSAGIGIFLTARIRPSVGHPEEHLFRFS